LRPIPFHADGTFRAADFNTIRLLTAPKAQEEACAKTYLLANLLNLEALPSLPAIEKPKGRLKPLPAVLRRELDALGRHFRGQGLRVFVSGSAARTWPNVASTSDLDLGFEWISPENRSIALQRTLENSIAELPTVRPVDLVDFSTVSPNFRTCAQQFQIELG
jgi:hypothetical protein